MTLFDAIAPADIFHEVLATCSEGKRAPQTPRNI